MNRQQQLLMNLLYDVGHDTKQRLQLGLATEGDQLIAYNAIEAATELVNSAVPNEIKLLALLKAIRPSFAEFVANSGDDHSVGVCNCADSSLLATMDAMLAAPADSKEGE